MCTTLSFLWAQQLKLYVQSCCIFQVCNKQSCCRRVKVISNLNRKNTSKSAPGILSTAAAHSLYWFCEKKSPPFWNILNNLSKVVYKTPTLFTLPARPESVGSVRPSVRPFVLSLTCKKGQKKKGSGGEKKVSGVFGWREEGKAKTHLVLFFLVLKAVLTDGRGSGAWRPDRTLVGSLRRPEMG